MAQKYTFFQKFAAGFFAVCMIFIIALFVAFGDGDKKEIPKPAYDAEMTEIKLQRLARGFVSASLKDSESAKFRNQKGVCGEVNAKNGFGGYSGFKRFIAANESLVVMEGDPALEAGAFRSAWNQFCK